MVEQHRCDFLHWLYFRAHDFATPLVHETAPVPPYGKKETANNKARVDGVYQGEPAYENFIIAGILG
jgi:hypothetical protein